MLPALGALDIKTLVPTSALKAGEKRKTKPVVQKLKIKQRPTLEQTLDVNGCAALRIPEANINTPEFIANVDKGTRDWFYARLNSALSPSATVPVMKNKNVIDSKKILQWETGRNTWNEFQHETKMAFFARLNLATAQGRENLFSTKKRKVAIADFAKDLPNSDALAYYLDDRAKYVKQGDSRMGLSAMYKSWSAAGFGKWAHIVPSHGIRAALALRDELEEKGISTQLSGSSHMIYKPPVGDKLPSHTDGPRPATMITLLEEFSRKNKRFPTTSEWIQDNGLQSLVHFDGGNVDGYTYSIGPMTPKKLYICLRAVQDGSIGLSNEELFEKTKKKKSDGDEDDDEQEEEAAVGIDKRISFLTGGTGPSFMKWLENIEKFNEILAQKGEGPIGELPIRPETDKPGAFVALWPNGFPHGSAPNKHRRITTTASLSVVGPNYKERDERVPERVSALAIIASELATPEQRARARATISSQTQPFYGGKTHIHPEHAGSWFDPDKISNGTGGFYQSIAPTLADAAAFSKAWKEGDAKYAPTTKEWENYEFVKKAMPPGSVARRPRFTNPEDAMED